MLKFETVFNRAANFLSTDCFSLIAIRSLSHIINLFDFRNLPSEFPADHYFILNHCQENHLHLLRTVLDIEKEIHALN